jgi:hypothetical protein
LESAASGQAQRVIMVSLAKSGTHLLQELMLALGYKMFGSGVRLTPETVPVLDRETRWRIARMVYDKDTISELEGVDEARFILATDRAWDALGWSWHIRLAQPLATWYTLELVDTGFVAQTHQRVEGSDFADTPANVCWAFSQFDITQLDGHFLHEWSETGEPRILFNYRDPRDVTLSAVNFLSDKSGKGFSAYNDSRVFSEILQAKDSLEEKLTYALTDPSFPTQGDFHTMLWLLNHPNVCKTSFEELIGPQGGGSAEEQTQALKRVFEFLGVTDQKPEEVASKLFNRDSFSFYKGQIGGWREAFTTEHWRLANERFGDVLQLYGYE